MMELNERKSISLNDESFKVLNASMNIPFLLLFWSPYCHHCTYFRKTWELFLNSTEFYDNIVIGDTNYENSPNLVRRFKIDGYPQVIWYDNLRDSQFNYDGAHVVSELEQFVSIQYSYPLSKINASDLDTEIPKSQTSSLFVLSVDSSDGEIVEEVHQSAMPFRNLSIRFLQVPGNRSLVVYRHPKLMITFNGTFTQAELTKFIDENKYPIIRELTEQLFDSMSKSGEVKVVFVTHEIDSVVESVVFNGTKSYAVYKSSGDWLCRYTGIKQYPSVMFLDTKNKRWAFYKGKWDASQILEWSESFNLTKARWKGPGNGLLGPFLEQVYSIRALEQPYLGIIYFLFVVIFVILGLMVYDLCLMNQEPLLKND